MQFINFLPILFLICLDWFALQNKKIKLGYATKPLVIFSILVWVWFTAQPFNLISNNFNKIVWLIFGLFFCLLGDILLMLPKRRFKAGLVVFLLAHISYNTSLAPIFHKTTMPPTIFLAIFIIPIVILMSYFLFKVANARKILNLYPYTIIYLLVISYTVFSGISTFFVWKTSPLYEYFVAFGALSMLYSDTLLGYRQWVEEKKYTRLYSRMLYQGGQLLFAVGVVSHFINL